MPATNPRAAKKFGFWRTSSRNRQPHREAAEDGRNSKARQRRGYSEQGQREGRVLAAEQEEELGELSNWIRPCFSPDGRQVLLATGSGNLWIANTDGSGEFIDILSQCSPDGTHIVFSSGCGNGQELWVVRNLLTAEAAEN